MKTINQIETDIENTLAEIRSNQTLIERSINSKDSSKEGGGEIKRLFKVISRLRSRLGILRDLRIYLSLSTEEEIRISYYEICKRVLAIESVSARLEKAEKKIYLNQVEYKKLKDQKNNLSYLFGK